MMVSPFTFYRGAAKVMAADLAATPVAGLEVQLCGDAHLSNFGAFASPERILLFDVNDFDETLPGPSSTKHEPAGHRPRSAHVITAAGALARPAFITSTTLAFSSALVSPCPVPSDLSH